ncbi:MAG: NAD(P)/FAD-dependent oxidoreductase [Candidatus Altiarchaeota archaeon]
MTVKILGAGLSGLSCAINLAGEREVKVYEKRKDVGEQIHPNLQGIGYGGSAATDFFRKVNIPLPENTRKFNKVFLLTPKRDISLNLSEPYTFVFRGGKNSFEYQLYQQALKMGVEVVFNSTVKEENADVIATGPKHADVVAFGGAYENTSFPDDSMLIMFDDRFSPKGWYFYIIPRGDGMVDAINCTPAIYAKKSRQLLEKAIKERALIRELMDGARLSSSFSSYGNGFIRESAVIDGRLYVGEAAGFQDPMMGFGMKYALTSGYLAAKSITSGEDYDALWRSEIMPQMKNDIARRELFSIVGSRLIERLYRDIDSGTLSSLPNPKASGLSLSVFEDALYRLGCAKKRFLGYW